MSKTGVGMSAIYDGGMAQGITITALGAGRRSHRSHRKHGSGIMDMVRQAHNMAKDKKLISKGLTALSGLAEKGGYGRRRRRH